MTPHASFERQVFSLAALPLFLAYGAFPAATLIARHWFGSVVRGGPEIAFLVLAGLGVLFTAVKPRSGAASLPRSVFWLALFGVLLTGLILYATPALSRSFAAMEAVEGFRPLALVLFGGLWAWTFGPPDGRDFQTWGAALGALALAGVLLNSWEAGALAGPGSGNDAKVWGALLAFSLCVWLCSPRVDRSPGGMIRWGLTFAAVLALMSRTGLIGLALCSLLLARRSMRVRILVTLACITAALGSFYIERTATETLDSISMHWLWWSGLTLILDTPRALLFGFPLARPLDLMIPDALRLVLSDTVLHPGELPAFWLRVLMTWGLSGVLAVILAALSMLARRPSRTACGVLLTAAFMGLNHELLYSAQTAAPLVLALAMVPESGVPEPAPETAGFVFSD